MSDVRTELLEVLDLTDWKDSATLFVELEKRCGKRFSASDIHVGLRSLRNNGAVESEQRPWGKRKRHLFRKVAKKDRPAHKRKLLKGKFGLFPKS